MVRSRKSCGITPHCLQAIENYSRGDPIMARVASFEATRGGGLPRHEAPKGILGLLHTLARLDSALSRPHPAAVFHNLQALGQNESRASGQVLVALSAPSISSSAEVARFALRNDSILFRVRCRPWWARLLWAVLIVLVVPLHRRPHCPPSSARSWPDMQARLGPNARRPA